MIAHLNRDPNQRFFYKIRIHVFSDNPLNWISFVKCFGRNRRRRRSLRPPVFAARDDGTSSPTPSVRRTTRRDHLSSAPPSPPTMTSPWRAPSRSSSRRPQTGIKHYGYGGGPAAFMDSLDPPVATRHASMTWVAMAEALPFRLVVTGGRHHCPSANYNVTN